MVRTNDDMVRPGALPEEAAHRADCVWGARKRPNEFGDRARVVRRGFTLVEVVIVLTIISTLGTIGVLQYIRANARYRVDAASERLIADLRLAQTKARTTGTSRTVRFIESSATYAILTQAEVASSATGYKVSLSEPPTKASMRVVGLPGDSISFDGRGEGNGGCIVVLKCGDAERAVRIEPGIGRAYVAGRE